MDDSNLNDKEIDIHMMYDDLYTLGYITHERKDAVVSELIDDYNDNYAFHNMDDLDRYMVNNIF